MKILNLSISFGLISLIALFTGMPEGIAGGSCTSDCNDDLYLGIPSEQMSSDPESGNYAPPKVREAQRLREMIGELPPMNGLGNFRPMRMSFNGVPDDLGVRDLMHYFEIPGAFLDDDSGLSPDSAAGFQRNGAAKRKSRRSLHSPRQIAIDQGVERTTDAG